MAISRKVTSAANVAASEAYHETRWSDIVDLLEEGGQEGEEYRNHFGFVAAVTV